MTNRRREEPAHVARETRWHADLCGFAALPYLDICGSSCARRSCNGSKLDSSPCDPFRSINSVIIYYMSYCVHVVHFTSGLYYN